MNWIKYDQPKKGERSRLDPRGTRPQLVTARGLPKIGIQPSKQRKMPRWSRNPDMYRIQLARKLAQPPDRTRCDRATRWNDVHSLEESKEPETPVVATKSQARTVRLVASTPKSPTVGATAEAAVTATGASHPPAAHWVPHNQRQHSPRQEEVGQPWSRAQTGISTGDASRDETTHSSWTEVSPVCARRVHGGNSWTMGVGNSVRSPLFPDSFPNEEYDISSNLSSNTFRPPAEQQWLPELLRTGRLAGDQQQEPNFKATVPHTDGFHRLYGALGEQNVAHPGRVQRAETGDVHAGRGTEDSSVEVRVGPVHHNGPSTSTYGCADAGLKACLIGKTTSQHGSSHQLSEDASLSDAIARRGTTLAVNGNTAGAADPAREQPEALCTDQPVSEPSCWQSEEEEGGEDSVPTVVRPKPFDQPESTAGHRTHGSNLADCPAAVSKTAGSVSTCARPEPARERLSLSEIVQELLYVPTNSHHSIQAKLQHPDFWTPLFQAREPLPQKCMKTGPRKPERPALTASKRAQNQDNFTGQPGADQPLPMIGNRPGHNMDMPAARSQAGVCSEAAPRATDASVPRPRDHGKGRNPEVANQLSNKNTPAILPTHDPRRENENFAHKNSVTPRKSCTNEARKIEESTRKQQHTNPCSVDNCDESWVSHQAASRDDDWLGVGDTTFPVSPQPARPRASLDATFVMTSDGSPLDHTFVVPPPEPPPYPTREKRGKSGEEGRGAHSTVYSSGESRAGTDRGSHGRSPSRRMQPVFCPPTPVRVVLELADRAVQTTPPQKQQRCTETQTSSGMSNRPSYIHSATQTSPIVTMGNVDAERTCACNCDRATVALVDHAMIIKTAGFNHPEDVTHVGRMLLASSTDTVEENVEDQGQSPAVARFQSCMADTYAQEVVATAVQVQKGSREVCISNALCEKKSRDQVDHDVVVVGPETGSDSTRTTCCPGTELDGNTLISHESAERSSSSSPVLGGSGLQQCPKNALPPPPTDTVSAAPPELTLGVTLCGGLNPDSGQETGLQAETDFGTKPAMPGNKDSDSGSLTVTSAQDASEPVEEIGVSPTGNDQPPFSPSQTITVEKETIRRIPSANHHHNQPPPISVRTCPPAVKRAYFNPPFAAKIAAGAAALAGAIEPCKSLPAETVGSVASAADSGPPAAEASCAAEPSRSAGRQAGPAEGAPEPSAA